MATGLSILERKQWWRDGYLLVPGVLSDDEIAAARAEILRFDSRRDQLSQPVAELLGAAGNDYDLCVLNAISVLPAIGRLIDHPNLFGKVLDLMGPYIYLAGSEAIVRYPGNDRGRPSHPFHTDGGPSLSRIFPHPGSLPISVKAQYFLTDVSRPDSGNMLAVPGSHLEPFPETPEQYAGLPAKATQILARAGDCVLFPWSLWHGATVNHRDFSRVSVVYRYAQLWCRPVDFEKPDASTLARLSDRQRRLTGDLGEGATTGDFYRPPTGEHLALIYGPEFSSCPGGERFVEWEATSHMLYAPEGTPVPESLQSLRPPRGGDDTYRD